MGRATREQADLNRERIVDSACKLFREHGVENASIAEVMKAAGLTPGGFYKHFESKDALVEEAFVLAFKQSTNTWRRTLTSRSVKGVSSPRTLAHKYFSQRATQRVCPLLSFASEVSQRPINSETVGLYERGARSLFDEFRKGLDRSAPLDAKPRSEADSLLLFAALIGAGMISRAAGNSDWTQAMQAAVMEALPKSSEYIG